MTDPGRRRVRLDEQAILDAARGYVKRLDAADVVTGAAVVAGPVLFENGMQAWLVDVKTVGTRLMVSMLVDGEGRTQFGHLWIAF
jgi:hypothetical protein